jgi:2-polyprenyl-3-methyl-5-hydroxy-6-metoxy-1,4-benzoquinol methylase
MTAAPAVDRSTLDVRARQTLGTSDEAIYAMVARALEGRHSGGGTLVDVGCGSGNLWRVVRDRFESYVGVDAVRYEALPADVAFCQTDLDAGRVPLPDDLGEVVAAVETIEHLENPRALVRELVRLAKPGGWIVITTPNQLSLLSLLTLAVKGRFSAFQDVHYPAHVTALLSVDLMRMAAEGGLLDARIAYSHRGRIALTPWHYPAPLTRLFPRALSDNLLLIARKPHAG